MISVILIEPSVAGNIGAVARVMANFGFSDLILVRPKCDHLGEEAQARSKHARDILVKAKVMNELPKKDYLIATTSIVGMHFNIPRTPINPKQLVELVKGRTKAKIGLVFGPEGPGLSNKDSEQCNVVLTIPTHKEYASMNLSHAVAIILYELYEAFGIEKVNEHHLMPDSATLKQAHKMVEDAIITLKFRSDEKRDVQREIWKKILGRLFLTKRELSAVMGFLKQIHHTKR